MAITAIVAPQIKLARTIEERFASQVAAEAGLRHAYFERISEKVPKSTPGYDSLAELNTPRNLELGKVLLTYKLSDEESRADINSISKEAFMRLPGINNNSAIVDNIIAYRDKKPFKAKEELLLIEGVTPEIFAQFRDFITVWSKGLVNINTVSDGALSILGFSDSFINALDNFRNNQNDVFKDAGQIKGVLEKVIAVLSEEDNKAMGSVNFGVKSYKFQLLAEAKFQNQPVRKYLVTFDIVTSKVLRWEED